MKTLVLSIILFASTLVSAEPSAPSAKQMTDWAAFSKLVHLKVEKLDRSDFPNWGNPVWVYRYSAKRETLSTYVIGLYKGGTLFGKNRTERQRRIEEQVEKFKEEAEEFSSRDIEEIERYIRIETRPGGRKVYFTIMGFGPGGAGYAGFTRVGEYDLLLYEIVDSEPNVPQGEKLKNPAQPTKELTDIFRHLETHNSDGKS